MLKLRLATHSVCILLFVQYQCRQGGVCVYVCACCQKCSLLHLETSLCSPGETFGSHMAQANGQLMGLHTARLVPKCLQIKQFIILCVHTYTCRNTYANTYASIHTNPPLQTPRNRPEPYHSVYTDCLALVNTQLTRLCPPVMMYLAVCFTWR